MHIRKSIINAYKVIAKKVTETWVKINVQFIVGNDGTCFVPVKCVQNLLTLLSPHIGRNLFYTTVQVTVIPSILSVLLPIRCNYFNV